MSMIDDLRVMLIADPQNTSTIGRDKDQDAIAGGDE
jgi:hypothetical protein